VASLTQIDQKQPKSESRFISGTKLFLREPLDAEQSRVVAGWEFGNLGIENLLQLL